MPIREFKCQLGHITEKLLIGIEDTELMVISCEFKGVTDFCGPECRPKEPEHQCREDAFRVDISNSSFRLAPGGAGGFYNPSRS